MGSRIRSRMLFFAVALAAVLGLSAGQASANHVHCGDTITQDTTLDSDLIDCPSIGIVIGADNITLDLNGHTIQGTCSPVCTSPAAAVRNNGHDGVTVANGSIRNFSTGISLLRASHNTVRALSFLVGQALEVPGPSRDNLIEGNVVRNLLSGTYTFILEESSDNRITHNLLADQGIQFFGSGGNLIDHNIVVDINMQGYSFDNRVVENYVSRTIYLGAADGTQVERNQLSYPGEPPPGVHTLGIFVVGTRNAEVVRNSVSNYGTGIVITYTLDDHAVPFPGNTAVRRNVVSGNAIDGIRVEESATHTLLRQNLTYRNGDDGIDVDNSATTLLANSANHNGEFGIEAVPGTRARGNRAFGNGNPLQCLNVVCR